MERETFDYKVAARKVTGPRPTGREAVTFVAMIAMAIAGLAIVLMQSRRIREYEGALSGLAEKVARSQEHAEMLGRIQRTSETQENLLRIQAEQIDDLREDLASLRRDLELLRANPADRPQGRQPDPR